MPRKKIADLLEQHTKKENSQTDSSIENSVSEGYPRGPDQAVDPPLSQTEPETAKKRRRIRGSKEDGEKNLSPESAEKKGPPKRRAAGGTAIVSIDAERSVESQDDKARNDLLDLVESMKVKRVLTDTIQGVERPGEHSGISYAVLYHGSFKIIIPANETVKTPEDFRGQDPAEVMFYLISKRLGAEVDYVVKGIDQATGIAAASRLEAMALKRREYYFSFGRAGDHILKEGGAAEARVISVIRPGIFVDLFGVEAYIPLSELSYQRWLDATNYYQPGQRVLVKILSINITSRDDIHVEASVKQAGENPYEAALQRYIPGNLYVGTVSVVDTTGVFVNLDGGIDCLCAFPKRGRPPRGSRVTVRVIGINRQMNRIWGAITHMAVK